MGEGEEGGREGRRLGSVDQQGQVTLAALTR